MNYIRKLFSSCYCLIYVLISYLTLFIISFIFALYDIDNLTYYVNNYVSQLSILVNLFICFVIIRKEKVKFNKFRLRLVYPFILFCLSFAIFYNMFLIKIGFEFSITLNIFLLIISSGIVGPLMEELIFRKCMIDKLLLFNDNKRALVLSSLIFAIIHFNLVGSIYAFILGLICGYLYLKRKNILESVVVHGVANIIVLFILEFNIYVFILSIIGLILALCLIVKLKK